MEEQIVNFKNKKLQLFIRDLADISVMREIFKFNEYKKADEKIKKAKNPILDVGAHVGFFSIYTRVLNKNVPIFAIEPDKENIKILKKHIIKNKLNGIEVFKCGFYSKTGTAFYHKTEDNHNGFIDEIKDKKTEEIKVFSLKDFCKKNKIKKVSLLKMDIEGGEYDIFENFKDKDFSLLESVIMEYHGDKTDKTKLEIIFRENGFGVQSFPSKFDKNMGFIFANNKRK